jgi:septal ring-binding cell division protein DamX
MRYVTILLVTLVSSCSWSWPWGGSKTGNCLDDGTCEGGANPFEEELIGGTWHCYGVSKKEPWDCSQERDDTKIIAVKDSPARVNRPEWVNSLGSINSPEPVLASEGNALADLRVEMALADTISSSPEAAGMEASTAQKAPETIDPLAGYSNTSFAIQLIALPTLEEVTQYAEDLNLNSPIYVKIRSQDSDWYVVLLGVYEDKSQADGAADEWASSHNTSSRPWVRPINPLRKAANLAAP